MLGKKLTAIEATHGKRKGHETVITVLSVLHTKVQYPFHPRVYTVLTPLCLLAPRAYCLVRSRLKSYRLTVDRREHVPRAQRANEHDVAHAVAKWSNEDRERKLAPHFLAIYNKNTTHKKMK